jgi:hypothetical protein
MKGTEFKAGEYCHFPNFEIPEMLDLLRENGHPVYKSNAVCQPKMDLILCYSDRDMLGFWSAHLDPAYHTELTRSEFLYKATRGNGVDPTIKESLIVQFDPAKPFEVLTVGEEWHKRPDAFYVGKDQNGNHVLQAGGGYYSYSFVRNTPSFNASMLNVGEYMETETGPDGKRNLLRRMSHELYTDLYDDNGGNIVLYPIDASKIKGRRVDVDLIVKEI